MAVYVYSNCISLGVGCILYSGATYAVDGKYSDGVNCYTVSGGNGVITSSELCGVYFEIHVPYLMDENNNPYTFAAVATDTVDTDVYLDIYWYSDLGGFAIGSVAVYQNTICGKDVNVYFTSGYPFFPITEYYNSSVVNISPTSFGTQNYYEGQITQYGGTFDNNICP